MKVLECAWQQGEDKQRTSIPDLILTGHSDIADFALGMSSAEPLVASGGKDKKVGNRVDSIIWYMRQ